MPYTRCIALLAASLASQAHALDPRSTIEAVGAPHLMRCEVRGAVDDGPLQLLLPATSLGTQPRPLAIAWDAHLPGQTLRSLRVDCLFAPDPQSAPARYIRVIGADDPFWRTVDGVALHPAASRPLRLAVQPMSLQPQAGADGFGDLYPALWGYTYREPLRRSIHSAYWIGNKARYVYVQPLLHAGGGLPHPGEAADVPEVGDVD